MVEENNDVIRCKFTNTITNAKKEDVWKKITERVNAVGVCERSKDEVREKWSGIQTNAKKAHVKRKMEERRTGGGGGVAPPATISAIEDTIIDLYAETPSFSGLPGFETGKYFLDYSLYIITTTTRNSTIIQ